MEWMVVTSISTAAGVCLVGFAQIRSWRRNGRDQKARDEVMALEQAQRDNDRDVRQQLRDQSIEGGYLAIVGRLDDPSHGLRALESSMGDIKTDVAEGLGRHDERLKALEADAD